MSASIRVADGFTADYPGVSGENTVGDFTAAGILFPVSAWKDGLLVGGTKGAGNVGPASIELGGLDPNAAYDITLLGVRYNGSHDACIAAYRVRGNADSDVKEVKTGLKKGYETFDDFTASFSGIRPASDGTITIEVTGIDTGVAAEGHINALVLAPAK